MYMFPLHHTQQRGIQCKGALVITLWRLVKGSFLSFWQEVQWLSGAFQTCWCQVTLSAQTTIQLQQPQLAPFLRMQQILWVMGSSQAFRSMDQWNPKSLNQLKFVKFIVDFIVDLNDCNSLSKHCTPLEASKSIEACWPTHLPLNCTHRPKIFEQRNNDQNDQPLPPLQPTRDKMQAATSGAQYSGDPKTSVRKAPSWDGRRRRKTCVGHKQILNPGLDAPRRGVDIRNDEPLSFFLREAEPFQCFFLRSFFTFLF